MIKRLALSPFVLIGLLYVMLINTLSMFVCWVFDSDYDHDASISILNEWLYWMRRTIK